MNKKFKTILKKMKFPQILALCAMIVSYVMANRNCVFIYHQPKMPDELKKLRGF